MLQLQTAVSAPAMVADQKDLINFIRRMRYRSCQVRLIDGDDKAKRVLRDKLEVLDSDESSKLIERSRASNEH